MNLQQSVNYSCCALKTMGIIYMLAGIGCLIVSIIYKNIPYIIYSLVYLFGPIAIYIFIKCCCCRDMEVKKEIIFV